MSSSQPERREPANEVGKHFEPEKKVKSRRPANTAFRQQRLKAWQPILTPKTVLPFFFVIGVIFSPIGALLLYASSQVEEILIDYSTCLTEAKGTTSPNSTMGINDYMPQDYITPYFKTQIGDGNGAQWRKYWTNVTYSQGVPTNNSGIKGGVSVPTQVCQIQFEIPNDIGPPVFLYYRLTNFFQNHRRYVKSLDTEQLSGKNVPNSTIASGSCDPLRLDASQRPYYPCGLIANSIFNDTFGNLHQVSGNEYQMSDLGIAWASDKKLYGKTTYDLSQIAVPPYWTERWGLAGYTADNPPPDLESYEAFQVWMRTAGLPAFSKLALRNDNDVMSKGRYQIDISFNFNVTDYNGTKQLVISTNTVMGGRNPFLGVAYVVVGGLCILLGAVFTVAHLIKPRKLGDHTHLTWNNDRQNQNTAVATGFSRPGNDAL